MNKSIVFHYLSKALLVGSAMFLIPSFVSLYYGETHTMLIFLIIGLVVGIVSVPLAVIKPRN